MPFIAKNQVRVHDTDMAGRLYYPRQFRFVNDGLEDMFASEGVNFDQAFNNGKFYVVIVHCESDYYAHLKVCDPLEIHIACERIGNTSFTLIYQIFRMNREKPELVGIARTVHVTLGAETHQKVPLPDELILLLKKYTI